MVRRTKSSGFTFLELIISMSLVVLLIYMMIPSGSSAQRSLTTEATAEELVARLRRARETARSKGVPVGVCIPSNSATAYSDTAYQLEGDINPQVSATWKIHQRFQDTVFYVGEWAGPNWAPATRLQTASLHFDPNDWWELGTPELACFIFTPSGDMVSNRNAGDGEFRIVVAQGVVSSGNNLVSASKPWTVSISPSGECSLEKGVFNGSSVLPSDSQRTPPGASYTPPGAGANSVPELAGPGNAGVFAYPNTDNPSSTGKIIDLSAVLTLEVRVKDADGDPPYFEWFTNAARDEFKNDLSPMTEWGGRFSNTGEVRMEWDPEEREWVGRTTWSPAPGDLGGNSYQLQCRVRDRQGGEIVTGFPVTGWLETIKEQWVLYRTIGPSGRWELWKMTLNGTDHQQLVAFPGQDVIFGEWGPSGDELIVAGAHGIFRASSEGGELRRINQSGLNGLTGVSISPRGDKALYTVGNRENYDIRQVTLNSGAEQDTKILDYSGSTDWVKGLKVTEINGEIWGVHTYHRRFWKPFSNRNRRGLMVVNLSTGQQSSNGKNPIVGGHNDTLTASFHGIDGDCQLIWSNTDNTIRIRDVVPSALAGSNLLELSGGRDLMPGQNQITFPRMTFDGTGCVYTSGAGVNSRIYYMPDINSPTAVKQIPLSPLNTGGRDVSISAPR